MKKLIFAIFAAIGMIFAGNVLSCKSNDTKNTDLVVITGEPTPKECPPVVITADHERKDILEIILSLKGFDQPVEWVIVDKPVQILYPNQNGSGFIEGFKVNGVEIPYSRTLLIKTEKILSKFSDHSVSEQKVLVEDLICSEQLKMLKSELEKARCDEQPTLAPVPPVVPDDDNDDGCWLWPFPWWLWVLLIAALLLFLFWLLNRLRDMDDGENEEVQQNHFVVPPAPAPAPSDEEGDPCRECKDYNSKCCCCREKELSKRWESAMLALSLRKEGSFSAEMQDGEFKISVSAEQPRETSHRKK
ncbi:MAG: hypothetical protein PHC89_01145 [Candidatus Pacebacteria bacterium]|nr:hypothetical protein [Candidatus Paceibacterota bacterium]